MAILFADDRGIENRGRASLLTVPGAAPASIIAAPNWGGFTEFKSIFTNLTISEQGNFDVMHTLGNDIFIYPFGDRIGEMGLSGLSFYDNCGYSQEGRVGVNYVIEYYRRFRLSSQPSPLMVTLAPDKVLRGYLTSFRAGVVDVSLRLFQFHLGFILLPDRR